MDTTNPDRLIWIDVETTGLDVAADHLLEVACLVTDTDLALLDAGGFHAVVRYDETEVTALRQAAPDVVREMHEATGLWDRLPTGQPLAQIEADLLAYIARYAPQRRQGRLAGNSVRLDAEFLGANLPAVADHLHYRVVDVSSIAYIASLWCQGEAGSAKRRDHSALSDIHESLEQLRTWRDVLAPSAPQALAWYQGLRAEP